MATPTDEQLREHLKTCLLDVINSFRSGQFNAGEQAYKVFSWAISVYVITTGFVITLTQATKFSMPGTKYLPLIPIILFWGLYAITRYYKRQNDDRFKETNYQYILSKLPLLSRLDLEALCHLPIQDMSNEPPKFTFSRFIKKIGLIICRELRDWRSMWLFGGMAAIWYFLICR